HKDLPPSDRCCSRRFIYARLELRRFRTFCFPYLRWNGSPSPVGLMDKRHGFSGYQSSWGSARIALELDPVTTSDIHVLLCCLFWREMGSADDLTA
ncbi:hypothetical protein AX14_006528, partial [Amanita brunnescens Koide BX004]